MQLYTSPVRGSSLPTLPFDQRYWPIQYANAEGTVGCTAYPINYDELYNLKGRLLTLVDATFSDPQQRKAHKDLVWQTLQAWMGDVESASDVAPPQGSDQSGDVHTN